MDYVYLFFGTLGVFGSLARVEFLTGRFERTDTSLHSLLQRPLYFDLLRRGQK
jgi:hypothetical protein